MKKSKRVWNVANSMDMTEYNAKLARKLRKMALHAMRIAKHYGVSYVDLCVLGDYVSARAKEDYGDEYPTLSVVDDYMFTIKEN